MSTSPRVRAKTRMSPLLFTLILAGAGVGATDVPALGQDSAAPQEVGGPGSANYELAARFAPYKIRELVHSTMVNPRWIEGTERFWYEWESSDGTFYYLVDPARGTRRELWDNDRIAAELTRITQDPWDGQHLPIQSIRFIDANTIRFDVTSSQDEEQEEQEVEEEQQQEEQRTGRSRTKKKVHHFEYDVNTQTLRELEDYEAPDNHPGWASVSPDGQTVVYAKEHNLWMMTDEEYQKVLDARRGKSGAEADSAEIDLELEETQLTTDGEEYYGYEANGSGRGETNKTRMENADKRKRASIVWSKDSRRLALVRQDQREVGLLWVVHTTGNERPELESYKYDMPGEDNVTQNEIVIYDLESRSQVTVQD
ncbi:MAG: DPP IV N-terminal domain-containing protein, partial [Gemmatimonadota bacterium]